MEVTVYIKLEGYDDGDFDVRNDYYASDDAFFDAMNRENQRNASLAYETASKLGNIVNSKTTNFSAYGRNNSKSATENSYKASAILINENGQPETVDNLISNCFTNDIVVNILKFDRDSMDEEFEEDFNFWVNDHNKINQYKDKLPPEKIWDGEPVRTLYVEFKNKANEIKYVRYENCKLVALNGNDECTILAENISLVDKI